MVKNALKLMRDIRRDCERLGWTPIETKYSLEKGFAVVAVRDKTDGKYSTHVFMPMHGLLSGQYALTEEEARTSVLQRFDDMKGALS